ncbi:MAG: PEP-CTERM sorting domain-containing protein [Planctomycetota bacterium]
MRTALCAALLLTAVSHATGATIPFSEDFDDNVADGFSVSSGWSAQNQQYEVDILGAGLTRTSSVELTNADGVPIVVSSDFNLSSLDGNVGFASFSDTASGTPFYLTDFDASGNLRIFEIAGSNTQLDSGTTFEPGQSFSLGTIYTLTATFTPDGTGGLDIVSELFDGTTLVASASGNDPTALTGDFFGYRGRTTTSSQANSIAGFGDNFSVTVVPEPASVGAIGFGLLLAARRRTS